LDIIKQDKNSQLLLLTIPEEGVDVFRSINSYIEEQIIEAGRESFREKIDLLPNPAMQNENG
jgi:hypothetical protein